MHTIREICLVLVFVRLHIVGIYGQGTETRIWPCPLDDEFLPCTCTETDTKLLNVDCSAAKTEEELAIAFSTAQFPFEKMDSLLIDHTNCDDCSLTVLLRDTFGPAAFREVQIHGTQLATIIEGAFTNSETILEVWNLSDNKIVSFTFEVVKAFAALETLDLTNNALENITQVQDITSATLQYLYLSNNPKVVFGPTLISNCPAIENLQMRNISLFQIPQISQDSSMFDGLSNLKSLDLSGNYLSELEANVIETGDASTLYDIYLSNNKISLLHPTFISNQGALGLLDMSNNEIERLDEAVWQPILHTMAQSTVDLRNNPLLCGCEIAWMVLNPTYLQTLHPDTTCYDGVTLVVNLLPGPYEDCEKLGLSEGVVNWAS